MKAVETIVVKEWCPECGWVGTVPLIRTTKCPKCKKTLRPCTYCPDEYLTCKQVRCTKFDSKTKQLKEQYVESFVRNTTKRNNKKTIEWCPQCEGEHTIPANHVSKCPECKEDIKPCSTCSDINLFCKFKECPVFDSTTGIKNDRDVILERVNEYTIQEKL